MSTLRTRGLAFVLALLVAAPGLAQTRAGNAEHWVTTWATAVVARGQQPAAAGNRAGGAGAGRGGGAVVTPGIVLPPPTAGRGGDAVVTPGIQVPDGRGAAAGAGAAGPVPPAQGIPVPPGQGAPAAPATGARQGGPAPAPFMVE